MGSSTSAANNERLVLVWRSPEDSWPEDQHLPPVGKDGRLGICLSGGGARSYACSMGALRALHDLGLLKKARYLVGVSGGAWAAAAYTFVQSDENELPDDGLLGKIWEPEQLSLEALSELDQRSARAAGVNYWGKLTSSISRSLSGSLLGGGSPKGSMHATGLHHVFLEHLGIPDNALMTWNEETRKDIVCRNPSLEHESWLLPRRRRPFPIFATTIAGPKALMPFPLHSRHYVQSEITPLYAGRVQTSDITYTDQSRSDAAKLHIGGLIEPIGYGTSPPATGLPDEATTGALHVPSPEREFTLERALSHSSWGGGAYLTQTWPNIAGAVLDSMPYWSPVAAKPTTAEMEMVMVDGGNLDNLGIMPLLQRRVEHIVMVMNTPDPLAQASCWDPHVATPTAAHVSSDLAALFGLYLDPLTEACWNYRNNKVFNENDFAFLAEKLQQAQARGTGAVATCKLCTVANEWWGVRGGDELELTVIYLARMPEWESRLCQDLRELFEQGGELPSEDYSLQLDEFPHVDTDARLGAAGANLLATFTASAVLWNKKELKHLFVGDSHIEGR